MASRTNAFADFTFDFGGIGGQPGVYSGTELEKGSFTIEYEDTFDADDGDCTVAVRLQVKVE